MKRTPLGGAVALVLSYLFDWIMIIIVAVIGYVFYKQTPNRHAFSLDELTISYPYMEHETVTVGTLALVSLLAPAVIIVLVCVVLVPSAAGAQRGATWSVKWRHILWEWNAGWLGLGVALAGAFTATQGLKAVVGKPRPDLLSRCDPDLSKIAAFAVSGLGQKLKGAPTMVTWEICRNKGDLLDSGFVSFPSGHSSFSFAGLTYLTLWLCAKLSVAFPYLPRYPVSWSPQMPTHRDVSNKIVSDTGASARMQDSSESSAAVHKLSLRNHGAAPPVYLLVIALVPISTAAFIAASRWFDYRHHGWDILFGSVLGLLFAWLGFRMYSLPIRRGGGWSWGARSPMFAFFKRMTVPSYTGDDSKWSSFEEEESLVSVNQETDLEIGRGTEPAVQSGSQPLDGSAGADGPDRRD